jgi:Protein of unknown function (DUF1116)
MDVVLLRGFVSLPAHVLLHAGPPLTSAPPEPMVNAAAQALGLENNAKTFAEGRRLVLDGAVEFRPAQDYGVVVPLAQIASPGMPMLVVGDGARRCCAPLSDGPPPALRFGSTDPGCLDRLRRWSDLFGALLRTALATSPVLVAPMVEYALARGDECHSRTAMANEALLATLPPLPDSALDTALRQAIGANPGFVLPLLMAAAAWSLGNPHSPIRAIGGNGISFGVKLAAEPLRWHTQAATPPRGPVFPDKGNNEPCGAIGDSAVIDACGLGGQALVAAPLLHAEWRDFLPEDFLARRDMILDREGRWLDPARIVVAGKGPIINLAILAADGSGLIGRGFFEPETELFTGGEI